MLLRRLEHRGFGDAQAHPQADHDQHDAEQERNPPTPGEELRLAGRGADHGHHSGGQQQTDRDPGLWPRRAQSATFGPPVLSGHQHRAAPLTAQGEALHQTQQHQDHRSPQPQGCERGKQADQERGDTHQGQRQHQHRLAADPVSEVAENHPADRSGEKPEGVRGEREHRADQRF
jgi:hypothetical protein